MGYHQAMPELEITGVDIHPQPHYPFNFMQADANELTSLSGYDIIHASPPCEGHTVGRWTEHDSYDLLHQAIRKLRETGKMRSLKTFGSDQTYCVAFHKNSGFF